MEIKVITMEHKSDRVKETKLLSMSDAYHRPTNSYYPEICVPIPDDDKEEDIQNMLLWSYDEQ